VRGWIVAGVPAFLCAAVLVLLSALGAIPPRLYPVFQTLPFAGFVLAFALGLVFRQSRVSFLACLMGVPAVVALRHGATIGTALALFGGLCLPVCAVVLHHLPERGIANAQGVRRAAFVVGVLAGLLMIACVPGMNETAEESRFWLVRPLWDAMRLPPSCLLLLLGGLPLLLVRREQESAALGPLLAVAVLQFQAATGSVAGSAPHGGLAGAVLYSAAAFTLVWIVVLSAWRHANVDELTELPGRRPLAHEMGCLEDPFAMAVVDLDHFKRVNDTYGHDVGDQVLRFLAATLRGNRAGAVYRQGGEEFVILSRREDFKTFVAALEDLRRAVAEKEFRLRGQDRPKKPAGQRRRGTKAASAQTIRLTVSIGAACSTARRGNAQSVLDAADKALYQAKNEGRNRVCAAK
jgi:GGDEF domain-containing protein